MLTDDAHVGTVAQQRGVDVWDLVLFLEASIRLDAIKSPDDLSTFLEDLRRADNYRFSEADTDALFDEF